MNLKHIDNNFFKLTARQAKALAMDNALPAEGRMRKANLDVVNARCKFFFRSTSTKSGWKEGQLGKITVGWISRTPLHMWEGKLVRGSFSWAIHISI